MDYYGDNVDLKGDQYWDIEWSHDILKRNMYNKYSSHHFTIMPKTSFFNNTPNFDYWCFM